MDFFLYLIFFGVHTVHHRAFQRLKYFIFFSHSVGVTTHYFTKGIFRVTFKEIITHVRFQFNYTIN